MICYRDRTYCSAIDCLNFTGCWRALTDEVRADAERIGLPISQFVNPNKNDCYKPHENTTHCAHQATD